MNTSYKSAIIAIFLGLAPCAGLCMDDTQTFMPAKHTRDEVSPEETPIKRRCTSDSLSEMSSPFSAASPGYPGSPSEKGEGEEGGEEEQPRPCTPPLVRNENGSYSIEGAYVPNHTSAISALFSSPGGSAAHNITEEIRNFSERATNPHIYIDMPIFSYQPWADALIAAKKNGCCVSINIDKEGQGKNEYGKKIIANFKREKIEVTECQNLHDKRIILHENHESIDDSTTIVFTGSMNASHSSVTDEENMIRVSSINPTGTPSRSNFFQRQILNHQTIKKGAALQTPNKRQPHGTMPTPERSINTRHSNTHDLDQSTIDFLNACKACPSHNPARIDISTMTFNNANIRSALIDLQQHDHASIRLLCDRQSLAQESWRRQLLQLSRNGVEVYIYNPYGEISRPSAPDYPSLWHHKYILRKIGAETSVLWGSANLTKDGNEGQHNTQNQSQDQELFNGFSAQFHSAVKSSRTVRLGYPCEPHNQLDWKRAIAAIPGAEKIKKEPPEKSFHP